MKTLSILTLLCIPVFAQVPFSPSYQIVTANPAGPCNHANLPQFNASTGIWWGCVGTVPGNWTTGVWSVTGPPGVGSTSLLSGTLAAIPAVCIPGTALYQATDQPSGLQVYACSAVNSWTRVTYAQGASNPATCSVGQMFFNTAASAGSNIQLCTSTNTFTAITGGGGITQLTGDVTAGPGSGSQVATIKPGLLPTVNITQSPYNAPCGSGDARPAIDAAYTALSTAAGGTITAPSGCVLHVASLITAKSTASAPVSLVDVVISQDTASAFAINFSGTTNASMEGVTLTNGGIVGTTSGATTGLRLTNVTVQNIASSTFPFNAGFYSTATLTNTRIFSSTFTNIQSGVYLFGTVSGFVVSQSTLTTISLNDAIQFTTGGTYSGLQLIDNKGSGFASQGIEIQGTLGDQALVRGNNFSAVAGFGISNGATGAGMLADGNTLAGTGSYGIELGANSTAVNNKITGFGQGIAINSGVSDVISNNTISNVANCIYASNAGLSNDIKVLGNVCNEPSANGIVMIDSTGAGGLISGNTVNRTPVVGDGSGTVVGYFAGSAAFPRTWTNNTMNWLSGTHGASANYWGFLLTANVPGSRYDGNKIVNNSGSTTNMLGIACNSFSTELNASAVTNSQFTNLATGINCPTTSTLQYANNGLNPGTTTPGVGMTGSNFSYIGGIRAVTTTTDTILSTDCNRAVTYNNASAVAVTLPLASTSFFPLTCTLQIVNLGAGTVTITPSTSSINLQSSLALTTRQGATIMSDGANYSAVLGTGTATAGTVTVVGAGSLVSTNCVTGGGSQTLQTPSVNCSVNGSGDLTANTGNFTNGVCTGASCPPFTSGTGGVQAWPEGTAPSAGPASGVDVCYADSTQHGILCSTNNRPYANIGSRGIPFSIGDPGGSALTAATTTTAYITVPFACTITAYNLMIDAGTVTVKFWKVATGTAIPTSAASINTSGVGISSGTAIHSATLSDFTTTTVTANDMMAMNVTAVATAKYINGVLQCNQ